MEKKKVRRAKKAKVGPKKHKKPRKAFIPKNKSSNLEKRRTQDTAASLLKDIQQGRLDPTYLTVEQRQACVLLLMNDKYSNRDLAAMLKVREAVIRNDKKSIRAKIGRDVRSWSMEEVIGDLVHASDRCAAKAMAQEDPGLAFSIKKDTVKMLHDLGVIGKESSGESGVRITIEALGERHTKMQEVMLDVLDPRLTGEEIPSGPAPSALELGEKGPPAPKGVPDPVEIVIDPPSGTSQG